MGAPALACSGEFFDMAHRANYFCFVLITLPIAIWGQDARDLIARADASVFAATTLHMSGSSLLSMDLPGATSMEVPFTISRAGERVRSDIGRLMNLQVEVFDGKTVTTYWASTNTYSRVVTRTTAEPMHLRILRFGQNASNLISAAVEREESPEFEARPTPAGEATVGNKRLTMQPTILGDPLAKLTPLRNCLEVTFPY